MAFMFSSTFEIYIIIKSDLLASDDISGRKTYNNLFIGNWNPKIRYTRIIKARVKEEYAIN
jgi:hypothetical protein